MSVIPVSPDLVEVTTLLLQPSQSFSSSSSGLTGRINLFAKPSSVIRSIRDAEVGSKFSDTSGITDDNDTLFIASEAYKTGAVRFDDLLESYLDLVTAASSPRDQSAAVNPVRFVAPDTFSPPEDGTSGETQAFDRYDWQNLQRRVINKCLMPDQVVENSLSFNGYMHYHSLNFMSSSNFGTGSAIVYPNFPDAFGVRPYTPDTAFTFDFFIKPKAPLDETDHFRAGTILHISSSICISLVSGSLLGPDSKPDSFKILLQLSQSADIQPSKINLASLPGAYPSDLVFTTDEVLRRDTWHRVTVRWGGDRRSSGTGSILVDNIYKNFTVNSSSISTRLSSDALVIGNFYDSGDSVARFFNTTDSIIYGTIADPLGSTTDPAGYKFDHPLNAEIHHVSIFKKALTDQNLIQINDLYSTSSALGGPSFFLAPFFTSSIPSTVRTYRTPNIYWFDSTDSPVSYEMALGYRSNYLNLQNFLVDYSQVRTPRAVGMSEGQLITSVFDSRTGSIDDYIMAQTVNRRRSFSILPCDDGLFEPDFSILLRDDTRFQSGTSFQNFGSSRFTGMISNDALAPPGFMPRGAFTKFTTFGDASYSYDGSSTYLPWYQDQNYFTPTDRLPDNSSNLPIVFSIPGMYYMTRIIPETFVLSDLSVSGSGGMSFTLRDDGRGNLYRSDTRSTAAKWNRVGALFYSHGIAVILSPHLPFFGRKSYEMSFRGEMRKTVATISIPAQSDAVNYSYNPTYQEFPPTQLSSEQASSFSYITGINLHDKNLNVIMRAKLAQPVQKREGDELVFRLRYDF